MKRDKHSRKIKYLLSNDPRGQKFNEYVVRNHPEFLEEQHPQLILVTGGDGAMLHAIQSNMQYQVPFLGHASGTLCYLMNNMDDYQTALPKILDPNTDLHIVETTSIKVDISSNDDGLLNLGFAVNEVVFGHDIMGYHSFVISSEDGSFDDFTIKGSGLSVCTDLGSTGYNFNLGGSVLPLGSNLWSVVGVACNRYLNDILHTQKLVVSSSKESRSGFSVFTDGIKKRENMGSNQVAILRKGPTIKIAFLNETDFVRKRVDIASRYRKY